MITKSIAIAIFFSCVTCDVLIPTLVRGEPRMTAPADLGSLAGKIRINGQIWETSCDCSKEHKSEIVPSCNPSNMKIFKDKPGTGLRLAQVRSAVGNIKDYSWTKVSKSSFTCVDGRVSSEQLSTLGGDAGEFFLALQTYQNYFGSPIKLSEKAIRRILRRYLRSMDSDKFTMCTDDLSISHLEKQLNIEGLDILNPQEIVKSKLLQALTEPLNMGDLHLRLLAKNPSMYNISADLLDKFLRSFYLTLWEDKKISKKIRLDVLVGSHNEKAFLEIKSNAVCTKDDLAPLFKQNQKDGSVFINHIDAVQIRRAQLAYFFSNVVNMNQDPINTDKLFSMINEQGVSALETTGSLIGKEIPFYSINII